MSTKMSAAGNIIQKMRPETMVGGFSRYDGTVEFYSRINALLREEMTVLDLGAGRGVSSHDQSKYRRNLQSFRGRVAEVIGADVDQAIAKNEKIDRYIIISSDGSLTLSDLSVDLVVCDWVFEHLERPEVTIAEIRRVLKPDGWLCARTPNKWGLTSVAARLIPNLFHQSALGWLQPHRKTQDVFPASYKMNSRSALYHLFPSRDWRTCIYGWNSDPAYHAESAIIWRATDLIFHLLPERLATTLHIFMQKAS